MIHFFIFKFQFFLHNHEEADPYYKSDVIHITRKRMFLMAEKDGRVQLITIRDAMLVLSQRIVM